MGTHEGRQGLSTVLILWLLLVPLVSAVCGFFVDPVTQRVQLFHPEFPRTVSVAIYTPNQYVRTLCTAGAPGLAIVSGLLASVIIACRWRGTRFALWVAGTAFVANMLFLVSVLCIFALELLRAFPFRGAA